MELMGKSRGKHRSINDEVEAKQVKRSGTQSEKRMSRNSTKQWESLIDDELEETLLLAESGEVAFRPEWEEAS